MAEAYMNYRGAGRWRAWSAGSHPVGAPNPLALETLENHKIPVPEGSDRPASKSWSVFAEKGAPAMDVIVTVCDSAAATPCPVWPSKNGATPQTLRWSFPDPAGETGSDTEKRAAFEKVFAAIKARIDLFIAETGANRNHVDE